MKTHTELYHVELYSKLGNLKHDFRNYNLFNLVASLIDGKKVLDIGCGSGILLSRLAEEGKGVQGIEPNEELIRLAQKLNPGIKLIKGTADLIKNMEGEFDAITMIDVLAQIENDADIIQDSYHALPKNGQFIIVVPAHQLLFGKRDINNGHLRRYSRRDLHSKLTKAGFSITLLRHWNILGVLPYFISEKILRRELQTSLRGADDLSPIGKIVNSTLNNWFRFIENNFGFGFGLSLIGCAEKH